ncbi:MAG: glycoside hydrolase family 3 N-terminal domain-containing protein [Micropruina sp.]|uniref:glycoside hydrolase family 3 N-terminal domain-containing protein n=1 Tax=Micropruina sp. TaxID=2737536 RepID=UPI0039E22AAF
MRPTPIPTAIAAGVLAGALLAPTGTAHAALPGPTQRTVSDGTTTFTVVTNPDGGATLSFIKDGPVKLLEEQTDKGVLAFKDMNGNGKLDPWEDWRKPVAERAKALAAELTIEQIAGLMLFSSHERNPGAGLTDAQRKYIKDDKLRNVLNAGPNDVAANVTWVNAMQAFAEQQTASGLPYVPVNFSSDPRSTAANDSAYNSEGDDISRWPSNIGLAATFSKSTMLKFAKASSAEYRAMGITTALGPQIDLATEPRWLRNDGTFGENVKLAKTMAKAYVNGSQNSYDAKGRSIGWGSDSINTMIKHWPGDGAGEGGRESHLNAGKYAVYPGNNYAEHTKPFLAAKNATAVMSSYSIAIAKNGKPLTGNRVGSAYDKVKIDGLRNAGYDGVICTDWGVTTGYTDPNSIFGMAWGMEKASVEERHYAVLRAGVDMYGGNNNKVPVLAAHALWQADYEAGKNSIDADTRFRQSGERIVRMLLLPGLFENPYLDLAASEKIVASADKVAAGIDAQFDSVVMLKNAKKTIKPTSLKSFKRKTVYIPSSIGHGFPSVFSQSTTDITGPTLDAEVAKKYFKKVLTDTPVKDAKGNIIDYIMPDLSKVDMVLAGMRSPDNGNNFTGAGRNADGSYYPLSLQWGPYTANGPHVRKKSIAGDIRDDGTVENRSYFGASARIGNAYDLTALNRTVKTIKRIERKTGKNIPIIVAVKAKSSFIPAEFEKKVDAILVGYSIYDRILIETALGQHEPQGRLPLTSPKNMDAVEKQKEDVGEDMTPYRDSQGRVYKFGYGLNWRGVIRS